MIETNGPLNLTYRIPEVVIAPIQGEHALRVYESVPEALRVNTRYDSESQAVIGSTPFLTTGIDDVVKEHGLRTLNLKDLSLPEVMDFARGNHYVDAKTLVARSLNDSYDRNNPLLRTIYELAEEKEGTIKGPFMIEGFGFNPNDDKDGNGYGLTVIAKPDFRVVQDERLLGKYNGNKFDSVDEDGLPLFDKKGERTWYARNDGLSGVFLNGDLGLSSGDRDLADSYGAGRVVVRSAGGADATGFAQARMKELEAIRKAKVAEIESRYQEALKLMQ